MTRRGGGLRPDPLSNLKPRFPGHDPARVAAVFLRGKYLLRPGLLEAGRISLAANAANIGSGSYAQVIFSTNGVVEYDTVIDDVFGNTGRLMASSANSKLVMATAGLYVVTASINWPSNATGVRGIQLKSSVDGVIGEVLLSALSGVNVHCPITLHRKFVEDEEVTLWGYQDSGGNLAPQSANEGTFLAAHWMASVQA